MRKKNCDTVIIMTAFIILVLSSLPYIRANLIQTADSQFLGMVYNSWDSNSYFMWMNQARHHGLFLKSSYAAPEEIPRYLNLLWLTLGKLSRIFHLRLPVLYQALHLLAGIVFLWLLYRVIFHIFKTRVERIFCYLLITLGSGFGWMSSILSGNLVSKDSTDLWMPETSVFFSLITFPHLVVAMTLLLAIYLLAFRSWYSQSVTVTLGAGCCVLILGFVHPYELFPLMASIGIFPLVLVIFGKRPNRATSLFCLAILMLSSLLLLYYYFLTRSSSAFSNWASANIMCSPRLVDYISGFGISFPLAILGLIAIMRKNSRTPENLLMAAWLITNIPLLYSYPLITFERRLAQGITIPMGILATRGLFTFTPLAQRPVSTIAKNVFTKRAFGMTILTVILLLAISMPTSLVHIYTISRFDMKNDYFDDSSMREAVRFLNIHTSKDDVILSTARNGNYLSRDCLCRIFVGHSELTPDFRRRSMMAHRFLNFPMSHYERFRFLETNRITYIYYGNDERAGESLILTAPYLQKVFSGGCISIYEVLK